MSRAVNCEKCLLDMFPQHKVILHKGVSALTGLLLLAIFLRCCLYVQVWQFKQMEREVVSKRKVAAMLGTNGLCVTRLGWRQQNRDCACVFIFNRSHGRDETSVQSRGGRGNVSWELGRGSKDDALRMCAFLLQCQPFPSVL